MVMNIDPAGLVLKKEARSQTRNAGEKLSA